jgi:hypothetical protein
MNRRLPAAPTVLLTTVLASACAPDSNDTPFLATTTPAAATERLVQVNGTIATMLWMSFRTQFTDPATLELLELYVPDDYVARSSQFGAMMVDLESFDFQPPSPASQSLLLFCMAPTNPGQPSAGRR